MPELLHRLAGAIASWLIDKPKSVAAMLMATLVLSAAALPTLKADSGTSAFIADGDPSRVFQKLVERQFIGEDVLFIGYETDDVFSLRALTELRALDEDLKALTMPTGDGGTIALVDDVMSLTTIKDVDGADQTYRSVPLVPDVIPTDPAALETIRTRALNNPMIRQGLLSKDKGVAGIEVRLVEGLDDDAFASVTQQVRKRIGEGSARFYLAGDPVATVDSATYQERDLQKFIPISYALLLAAMSIFTRRLAGVMLALVNATLAVVFSMAMVALFGKLTNLSSIMPPLVIVISMATIVHFTSEYARQSPTLERLAAAKRTLHELLVPTFMCELTTAVGFISFALSPIPALREFGLAAAIAVMGVFVISFLVLALDISTTMIASIILGIVVDDTTHFIQTIRACLTQGVPMEEAIRKTMATKGVGALWITLIITMGFVALVTSSFKPTMSFGILTAFGMMSGAFAEMCMLPPMLLVTKTRLGVKPSAERTS